MSKPLTEFESWMFTILNDLNMKIASIEDKLDDVRSLLGFKEMFKENGGDV